MGHIKKLCFICLYDGKTQKRSKQWLKYNTVIQTRDENCLVCKYISKKIRSEELFLISYWYCRGTELHNTGDKKVKVMNANGQWYSYNFSRMLGGIRSRKTTLSLPLFGLHYCQILKSHEVCIVWATDCGEVTCVMTNFRTSHAKGNSLTIRNIQKLFRFTRSWWILRKRVITCTYKPSTKHSRAPFKCEIKCTNFINFKYTGRSRNLSSKICTEFWRLSIIQNGPWYCYT